MNLDKLSVVKYFNVGSIKISLLLKIQWKQHHILYVKIVYEYDVQKVHARRLRGTGITVEAA